MYDITEIFRNPAGDIRVVCRSVLAVFSAQPKVFSSLAFFQMVSILISLLLDAVISGVFFKLNCKIDSRIRRFLMTDDDFFGGSYGMQDDSGDGDINEMQEEYNEMQEELYNEMPEVSEMCSTESLGQLIGGVLMSVIVHISILTIFGNAIMYAATDTYSGALPGVLSSLGKGCKKFCHVFTFQCILGLVFGVIYVLIVFLPTKAAKASTEIYIYILTAIIYLIICCVLYSVMIAGVPSIIVENHSPFSAFSRSWNLCKSSICFIFCSIIWFPVLVLVAVWITYDIQEKTNGATTYFSMFAPFGIFAVLSSGAVILHVVLYFLMRVRSEGYTQAVLSSEHEGHFPDGGVEAAIEMT